MTLLERDAEALARGVANLRRIFDGAAKRGRLSEAAAAERLAGVTGENFFRLFGKASL